MKRLFFKYYHYEALAYLAGVLDYRGHFRIENNRLLVSLRVPGRLPRELKEQFGGTCFVQGSPKRYWYKVRGDRAREILELVQPYLIQQADVLRNSWPTGL